MGVLCRSCLVNNNCGVSTDCSRLCATGNMKINFVKWSQLLQRNLRETQRRYNSGLVGYPKYKPLPPPPPGPLAPIHPNWLIYISGGLVYGLHVLNKDEDLRRKVEEEGKFVNLKDKLDIVLPLVAQAETTLRTGYEAANALVAVIGGEVSSAKASVTTLSDKMMEGVLTRIKAVTK